VKLWQVLGTGSEKLDLAYWRQKKIPVANIPGQFSSVALAEPPSCS
jgi:lactate dehydrogenase-like 2-hydroxyacid dehydrogenase